MDNNQNINLDRCAHVQLDGQAFYDERKYFLFSPIDPRPDLVPRVRRMTGVAQQMTDGTFNFVARPRRRPQTSLIKKLAHGRASRTKDGNIQLWLKVSPRENLNISETIAREAIMAAEAIKDWQLKK